MAEITTASSVNKPGVRRSKKHSTRVDLTPMVDLGFLLITFFVFTTSMSKPSEMKVVMPADSNIEMPVKESTSLTLIPMKDNKVLYYHGLLKEAIQQKAFGITDYSVREGIGTVIRKKQELLDKLGVDRKDLLLIIKPSNECNFGNAVDILDEVLINVVARYAFVDLAKTEKDAFAVMNIDL